MRSTSAERSFLKPPPYLAWARGKGMPVVHVCSARRRSDKWFLKFWELANESGFFGSDLELTLRELDVGALQLIGWSTSLAVATTAIDAWQPTN